MSDPVQPDVRRLRAIVVVQGITGMITFVPSLLLAGMAFGTTALFKPENLALAIWSATAVIAAAFNVLGGVALYYNPRPRVILGSLTVSVLLLVAFVFGIL